jgi:hypothetical protein
MYKYTKHEKIYIHAVHIKRFYEIYTKTYDDASTSPNFLSTFRKSAVSHTNNTVHIFLVDYFWLANTKFWLIFVRF